MDSIAHVVIDLLEKLNSILVSPVIQQTDIEKGQKIVFALEDDAKKFYENINILERLSFEKNSVDVEQLTKIINNLNSMIRKLDKIDKFITIAAQTHVANMEKEGYVDDEF